MFCSSIRKRPWLVPLLPTLTLGSRLNLREQNLATHDIALSLDPNPHRNPPTRQLRLLLLSAADLVDARLSATISRIKHLAAITSNRDMAIVFSLSPPRDTTFQSAKQFAAKEAGSGDGDSTAGTLAYAALQAELMSHTDIPMVTILPLASLEGLSELLKKHVAAITAHLPPKPTVPMSTPFELLRQCTANPPMLQETVNFLSDLFPGIRELAAVCSDVTSAPNSSSPSTSTQPGSSTSHFFQAPGDEYDVPQNNAADSKLKQLRDLVGDEQCRSVVDFWKEEWTVN